MTDRELLELAAKAAGLEPFDAWGLPFVKGDGIAPRLTWNPLADDGDALRLVVKLGLSVIPYPIYVHPKHSVIAKVYKDSAAVYRDEGTRIEQIEDYGDDPAAATRRAIVSAAAQIGKAMP